VWVDRVMAGFEMAQSNTNCLHVCAFYDSRNQNLRKVTRKIFWPEAEVVVVVA